MTKVFDNDAGFNTGRGVLGALPRPFFFHKRYFMKQQIEALRKLMIQVIDALENMEQRIEKLEADIIAVDRWIDKQEEKE